LRSKIQKEARVGPYLKKIFTFSGYFHM